jgi:hypothetical protein
MCPQQKMIKSHKIHNLDSSALHITVHPEQNQDFLFLLGPKYKYTIYFILKIYTHLDHNIVYMLIFFIFFEICKLKFLEV